MKNVFRQITIYMFFGYCNLIAQEYKYVKIDTLFKEKISIRAIIVDSDKLWYAGDNGQVGFIDIRTTLNSNKQIVKDNLKLEFRSIAKTSKNIFLNNIGSPAIVFKINKKNLKEEIVYTETNEKTFYDSMQFWNDQEGIAIGDPTEDCFSILLTCDGGNSWNKLSCESLPKLMEGEAAFAASNTNIVAKGNNTWVVSGGKKARVFFSADKGHTWNVYDTPIVQGKDMTGIFSSDFYNDKIGIVAGGDYELPEQNFQNKAITLDGGKTWKLLAENSGFGYASCIQFIPNSNGKGIVSVGLTGLHYSFDGGNSWKQLSSDSTFYTIRFLDKYTAFAAGKNKIVKIEFKI